MLTTEATVYHLMHMVTITKIIDDDSLFLTCLIMEDIIVSFYGT